VGAEPHRKLLRDALKGRPPVKTLLEPEARNTAAAIAWAAAAIQGEGGAGLLAVLPADHHVPDPRSFARVIRQAARIAHRQDRLVIVGISPRRPDPAYGYLRVGKPGPDGALPVRRFVEKPSAARAQSYVRSGSYLWNAGMVVATAPRILAELRTHAPEVWRALGSVLEDLARGARVPRRRLAAAYRRVRPIAFDHAVLERTRRVVAVRGRFAWSDLGSWDALKEHLPMVEGDNHVQGGKPLLLEARNNVIWNTSGRAVALLGVDGLAVVDTEDALLICPLDRSQEVRRVVEELARQGRKELI
jgi:mannose-1-phosphate guanylyltransferase/mannose-6-phosphate isomerase